MTDINAKAAEKNEFKVTIKIEYKGKVSKIKVKVEDVAALKSMLKASVADIKDIVGNKKSTLKQNLSCKFPMKRVSYIGDPFLYLLILIFTYIVVG